MSLSTHDSDNNTDNMQWRSQDQRPPTTCSQAKKAPSAAAKKQTKPARKTTKAMDKKEVDQ